MVAAAVVGSAVVGAVASSSSARSAKKASDKASRRAQKAAGSAEALNIDRFEDAETRLNPYLERELQASNQLLSELGLTPYAGLPGDTGVGGTDVRNIQPSGASPAYLQSPGYLRTQEALDAIESEQIEAVNQGAVNAGTLYSGRRGEALSEVGASTQLARAQTENQFYNNYLNILQNLSSPQSTTNLSSLGVDQAATIGSQNIAATDRANQYTLGGVAATNAARADFAGGVGNLASAYIAGGYGDTGGVPINQELANTTGTITPNYAYL